MPSANRRLLIALPSTLAFPDFSSRPSRHDPFEENIEEGERQNTSFFTSTVQSHSLVP